jgi:Ser-tRNA(Ala) deacylase AlaX
MQQHSGEHILSAVFPISSRGNIGFHLGAEPFY